MWEPSNDQQSFVETVVKTPFSVINYKPCSELGPPGILACSQTLCFSFLEIVERAYENTNWRDLLSARKMSVDRLLEYFLLMC